MPRTITIYDDDVSCPKCGHDLENYKGYFQPDNGDDEARVICVCGIPYTIVRTVIAAEYSVKK